MMAIIYSGNFYRPEEPPKRLGAHPAPDGQEMPRIFPLLFLLSGIVLTGMLAWSLAGLLSWAARAIAEVTR